MMEEGEAFVNGRGGFKRGLREKLPHHFFAHLLQLAALAAQGGLYLAARLGRGGEVEPFVLDVLLVRREDFHLVAALELVAKRHEFVVHLSPEAMRTEEGVDGESKVHHRCACRHLAQLALRREHHNLVRKEVELNRVEEVERVGLRVVEDFLDRIEPLVQFVLVVSGVLVLIFPVRGKTLLGDVVHAVGADLHLNPLPVLAHKRVVERLIAVGLGVGHPVAEARGVRLINIG